MKGRYNMISDFLSEAAVNLHKEYIKKRKLQYSIFEKSIPQILGKDIYQIKRMRLTDKTDILKLKCEILCHEIFFSSFGSAYESSVAVRKAYRTEASFIYELYELGKNEDQCFIIIYLDRGELKIVSGMPEIISEIWDPILVIDLYEHSYFLDYGFDKDAYLKNMLPFLNFSKIDKFLRYKD